MGHFLLSVILFLMMIFGFISLLFASRFPPIMIWNLFWYFVMGALAQRVFNSPWGLLLGATFAGIYVLKAYTRPRTGGVFIKVFKNSYSNGRDDGTSQIRRTRTDQQGPRVIDADFVRVDPSRPNKDNE